MLRTDVWRAARADDHLMTNSYYLAHDVELHRSRLQAEAAARPHRTRTHRRFRDMIPAMARTKSRKPQLLLLPRPDVARTS